MSCNINGLDSLFVSTSEVIRPTENDNIALYYILLSGADENKIFNMEHVFPANVIFGSYHLPQPLRVTHNGKDQVVLLISEKDVAPTDSRRGYNAFLTDGTTENTKRLGQTSGRSNRFLLMMIHSFATTCS